MRLIEWKYTTAPMNARDLARDDDFVRSVGLFSLFIYMFAHALYFRVFFEFNSHMLVECLGIVEPLLVHKMDASRRLPTWEPELILNIVQKVSLDTSRR